MGEGRATCPAAMIPVQRCWREARGTTPKRTPELIDWAVRRLIINADDFGLSHAVNRAVMELHGEGALTSVTLMASAAAAEEAIETAMKTPTLGVGCHVVLVDGVPALPALEIPSLADQRTNQFHQTLSAFLRLALTGRIDPGEIEAEATAQISLLQSSGLRLTHVDTHKHTHMFPIVLRPVLRAARAAGISSVRNPFEPAWSRRATIGAPIMRRLQVTLLQRLEARFRRIAAEEGFTTTDGALGVLATGTLDAAAINSLLADMPDGTWELVTHPGYHNSELTQVRTRLKGSRERERQALMTIKWPENVELINFAHLDAGKTEITMGSPMK